jgi:hypothetical protein
MNLKQIMERLNTLYYVTKSVSFDEEKGGLFIFFSQYKSILGQCNKLYPKEETIKKMLLNTFHIRSMLNQTESAGAQGALQNEIKALTKLIMRIDQLPKPSVLHKQLTDTTQINGGAAENRG